MLDKKSAQKDKCEYMIRDFIVVYEDLVDKEVLAKFMRGDNQAIASALQQIHESSLLQRKYVESEKTSKEKDSRKDHGNGKSYAEVLKMPVEDGKGKKTKDWIVVTHKKSRSPIRSNKNETTIFMSKIPTEASAKDIWEIFLRGGIVKDIILPRKRDKQNNMIGFVKTTCELEAGKIINNVK